MVAAVDGVAMGELALRGEGEVVERQGAGAGGRRGRKVEEGWGIACFEQRWVLREQSWVRGCKAR